MYLSITDSRHNTQLNLCRLRLTTAVTLCLRSLTTVTLCLLRIADRLRGILISRCIREILYFVLKPVIFCCQAYHQSQKHKAQGIQHNPLHIIQLLFLIIPGHKLLFVLLLFCRSFILLYLLFIIVVILIHFFHFFHFIL